MPFRLVCSPFVTLFADGVCVNSIKIPFKRDGFYSHNITFGTRENPTDKISIRDALKFVEEYYTLPMTEDVFEFIYI